MSSRRASLRLHNSRFCAARFRKYDFLGLPGVAMRLRTAMTVSCLAFAASAAPALAQATACANPNALGLARTVEVDTTGGPGFGFEQYKQYDFLASRRWC